MVSARLSASATKKPVSHHPMVILMLFSPRQSNPPRLYPLARIGSTSYIDESHGIVLRRKSLILKND